MSDQQPPSPATETTAEKHARRWYRQDHFATKEGAERAYFRVLAESLDRGRRIDMLQRKLAAARKRAKRQSSPAVPPVRDAWQDVETHIADLIVPETGMVWLGVPVYLKEDVGAARAADTEAHQEEITAAFDALTANGGTQLRTGLAASIAMTLRSMNETREALIARAQKAEAELATAQQEIEDLETTRNNAYDEAMRLGAKLRRAEAELATLRQERDAAKLRWDDWQKVAIDRSVEIDKLMQEKDEAQTEITRLREKLEQIASLRLDSEELIVKHSEFYKGVSQGLENARIIARAAITPPAAVPQEEPKCNCDGGEWLHDETCPMFRSGGSDGQ